MCLTFTQTNTLKKLTMIKLLNTLSILLLTSTPVFAVNEIQDSLKASCIAINDELTLSNIGSTEYVEYIPVCVIQYSNGDVVVRSEGKDDYLMPSYLSIEECLKRMRENKTTMCK